MDKNTTFKKLFVFGKIGLRKQHRLEFKNSKYCFHINYFNYNFSSSSYNIRASNSTFIHIEIGELDYVIKIDENSFDIIFFVQDLIK